MRDERLLIPLFTFSLFYLFTFKKVLRPCNWWFQVPSVLPLLLRLRYGGLSPKYCASSWY